MQAGRPTLEVVDWGMHYPTNELGFELRPAARIQGPNVNVITMPTEEQGQIQGQGPILVTNLNL